MASLKRGRVDIELAGDPYTLVFNYGTLADIESEFGDKPIDSIYFNGEGLSRKAIIQGVRHGLTAKHRAMSAKKVARLIAETIDDDEEAVGRITRAVLSGILGGSGASQDDLDRFNSAVDEAEEEVRAESQEESSEDENPTRPISSEEEIGES